MTAQPYVQRMRLTRRCGRKESEPKTAWPARWRGLNAVRRATHRRARRHTGRRHLGRTARQRRGAVERDGQIDFIYLDIDDAKNADAKERLGFRVQPQFFFLDTNGNVIQEWFGPVKAEDFQPAFAQVLTSWRAAHQYCFSD